MSDEVKKLRNEVQFLRDELAIMRRKFEDIIYNLDTDNFSSRFVKEQGDMRTAVEVTAEGIKTKVSKEEMESAIRQTAEKIETELSALSDTDDDLYSKISQTASSISSVVGKDLSTKFKIAVFPTKDNTTARQKGVLCEYQGALFYYNDIKGQWLPYPHASGVKSQFLQTASGFKLTGDVAIGGDVEISGDAIVGGTITGASFQNSDGTTELELGTGTGNYGDLKLSRWAGGDKTELFCVYDDATSVKLQILGESILYSAGNTTYPLGTWDFKYCDSSIGGGTAKFA